MITLKTRRSHSRRQRADRPLPRWFRSRPRIEWMEDRTLLSHEQMRAIVNEASGERALHHVLELVPYPRIRPISEYQGHFQESEVMARLDDGGFLHHYAFGPGAQPAAAIPVTDSALRALERLSDGNPYPPPAP